MFMDNNSTQPACDNVAKGHIETTAGMTDTTHKSPVDESFNVFILLEHEFLARIETGELDNLKDTYSTFTKTVVMLFHGDYNKSEVHSALIVAEDHLTVILEDSTHLEESYLRFIERAINFIKRYINRIGEWIESHPLKEGEVTVVKATVSGNEINIEEAATINWSGKFTEIVELVYALLLSGKVNTETDAEFIRGIFGLFGIKKAMTDYYKALKKIEEKHPKEDDAPGRCKLLKQLLDDTEKDLQKKYLGKAA